ncbi:MAG: response regulator transcription factor [Hyphomicrobiales bacterium]|nr:response regulator transcription factor [Hyphomicrobiales bacterium]
MNSQNELSDGRERQPHIVIVDDDVRLRDLVSKVLVDEGWRVTGCRDGRALQTMLAAGPADIVILDVMLSGASGLEVCRDLRRVSNVPIIMLTAKSEETDRVVGLEMGADDYLGKPFSSRELVARIRALLRRASGLAGPPPAVTSRRYRFEGWTLDTVRRELTNADGVIIDLTTGEYELLLAFIEAPRRVLTRDQLLDLSRGRATSGFDRSIDVQISRVRRKLGAEEGETIIKTVRGAGYMFVPSVVRL